MLKSNADKNATDFREVYAVVVAEAMSVLGEGTSLITNFLEKKYSLTLSETADDPQALSEALGAALGGSMKIIQRRILRLLYERINLKFPSYMTNDFVGRIKEVRKAYEKLSPLNSPDVKL